MDDIVKLLLLTCDLSCPYLDAIMLLLLLLWLLFLPADDI